MEREEIINKKFPHAFWGYDVTEVDLFLDEIIREMDRLHNELDIAEFTAEAARQREEKLKEKLALLSGERDTEASAGEAAEEEEGAQDGSEAEETEAEAEQNNAE